MNSHIINALRPEPPDLDPDWESETVRAILEDRTAARRYATGRGGRRLMDVALVAAAVVTLIGGVVVARHFLPADDVRPAKPVQDKIQKIDPSKATKLKLDVVADLPTTYKGDQVLFWSFIDDNVVAGTATQVQDENAPGAKPLMPSHPVLYDLTTKTFTVLDDRDRPVPTQIVDESGDENTVIWTELVGTSIDTSDFTIYSYDRHTKQVTTLGHFNDPDGQIVYDRDLTLVGDMAYVSTAAYPKKSGQQAVYAMPVDGSKGPRVIAKGGQDVRISGDTLTYAVRNSKDRKAYPTYFRYDLRTGKTTPAPVSAHVGDPAFCGAEFTDAWETWCAGDPPLLTIKEASGRTTRFAPFPVSPNAPHNVIALGRWTGVTVTANGGQSREYLVNLDTKEMKVFPGNTSFTSLSPDRSTVLITSFAKKGPGPEHIVRIPD